MKIKNAKIKNVTNIRADSKRNLIVSLEIQDGLKLIAIFVFKLSNPVELQNLLKLMEFVGVQDLKDFEEREIRVAKYEDVVKAIGHPIEEKFLDITNIKTDLVKELSISELLTEYSNQT